MDSPSMPRTRIQAILAAGQPGESVRIEGWVRTRRDSKDITFLEINDGSSLASLQVVVSSDSALHEKSGKASTGSSIEIEGDLKASEGKGQRVELIPSALHVLQSAEADYPLQKKRHGFEFLRTIAHLRVRSNTFGAVNRVRNALFFATHRFFQEREFLFLQAPIITASDAEGAGEMFRVTALDMEKLAAQDKPLAWESDFFGRKAGLTVSGQLQAEIFALAFHDCYTFGPTFRAENSNTSRHAAEFWMIEPEIAFADLGANRELAESFIKTVIRNTLEQCPLDFEFFDQRIEKGLLEKLKRIIESPFETITYTEAISLLEKSGEDFEFPVAWGSDLQSEHERYLAEKKIGRPLFVIDYPKDIKAFYMRSNDDGRTVAAMDLLVPGLGEIIGGSQREERMEPLLERMDRMGISREEYAWYLDLRRYGSAPHAGFGVGFERLLMYVTGMQNIRDVIPFPRTPGHVEF